MEYFNVVLLPPKVLSEKLTDFAQANFKELADGLCLSGKVLPHITLCQFRAEGLPDISIEAVQKTPQFKNFNLREGTGQHAGYIWAELTVENEDWLSDLHKGVKSKLSSKGCEILTKHYAPHLTFCRVDKKNRANVDLKKEIPEEFFKSCDGWRIGVGKSDKNGQYLG